MINLFNLSLRLNGFPIEKATNEYQKIKEVEAKDFEAYNHKRKQYILHFHLEHNSFYRAKTDGVKLDSWEDLPVLTKKDLQIPLEDRISNGYNIKDLFVNKTSGSSGDPFIFCKDKQAHAMTWASIIDKFSWYDINFNHSYQARFYGIPLDKFGYYKERIKDLLSRRYRFPIFNLDDAYLNEITTVFKNKKFDYINGYTSSLVLYAKFLQKKGWCLKDLCPTLKVVMVTSEMLFEEDKKIMEEFFGVPIVNEYGASELDLIAFQTPDGLWKVNTETLFVEILDENNRPLPHGKEGKIVITSLYNKAHPFIRYEIGDIGSLTADSTPSLPILKKLVGRTSDVALLPSGKTIPGLTFYYVTKSVIKDDGNVKEFVVKQTQPDTFQIHYVADVELSNADKAEIIKAGEVYLEKGLVYQFQRHHVLERSKSGKLKQFQSLVPKQEAIGVSKD